MAMHVYIFIKIEDFPEGAPNSGDANILLTHFFSKLHENEEILAPGGRASIAPPRSATGNMYI